MKVKQKFLRALLVLCMIFSIVPTKVYAMDSVPTSKWTDYAATSFAGGTGTKEDPYQIATAEQLAKLSVDVSNGNSYTGMFFKLTDNIDLNGHRWVPIGIYQQIQNENNECTNQFFAGFIDGNNKTISGLIVDERTDKYAAGLFGIIVNMNSDTVGVKDLTISNANIYASEEGLEDLYAGILVGWASANLGYKITFENITVSGAIEVESTNGNTSVGGMIGKGSRVSATDCKAENISITGASKSGGIVGFDSDSYYENCEVSGKVSGVAKLGGFVGETATGDMGNDDTYPVYKNCIADVDVTGSQLGGFAGYAVYGKFDNCVAFGDVTSTDSFGGVAYTGDLILIGGFMGSSHDATVIVNSCHAAGKITSATTSNYALCTGGFVGVYKGGTFTDCSFDGDKNSGLNSIGAFHNSTGVVAVSGIEAVGSEKTWEICERYYGNHKYGDWTIDKEATCAEEGSKSKYCLHCNKKTEETINKSTSHTWEEGVVTKEATATEKGEKTYTCSVCKTTKKEEIPALGAPAVGEEITSEDGSATYKVTEAGENGNSVTYEAPTDKNQATVVVPATVTINNITYNVTTISDTAFAGNKKLTSVTIGDNVTGFSDKTFKGCSNLKTVDVGNGVTSIPANAFKNFKKLTTVKMGTGVKTIGKNAFYGCKKLKNLTIGKNVVAIGDKAFYKCTSLTKVTIPSKVKTIGKSAFEGCKKLKTVTIGKSVTKIGAKAFYGCSKVKTLTIKSSKLITKKIGSKAFSKTPKSMTVKVPKKKFTAYKSMLIKKGVNKKAKFKKN